MQRNRSWLMVSLIIAAGLFICGCVQNAPAATKTKPATTESIAGSSLKRVILTEEGARRIDLRTEPIREDANGRAMPYAAIVYDKAGATWAYAPTEQPLTFVRQSVSVDSVKGSTAYLKEGPPPGTRVVTVGVAELFGVEFGFQK